MYPDVLTVGEYDVMREAMGVREGEAEWAAELLGTDEIVWRLDGLPEFAEVPEFTELPEITELPEFV